MRSFMRAISIGAVCLLFLGFGEWARAQTQPKTPTVAPATTQGREGRFQLVTAAEGPVFLVDTVEGRIWRYTRLTIPVTPAVLPPESVIEKYVDDRIVADEAEIGRRYTAVERLARGKAIRELEKLQIEKLGTPPRPQFDNPCHGTETCFLEVDRLRLTPSGWSSEILK